MKKKNILTYSLLFLLGLGLTSCAGAQGETGPQGPQGEQGIQGEKGDKGDKGDTGATGPQGEQGEKGDKGDKGDTGATGPQGDKGDTGPQGETAWSNTILPSVGGYILPSVGSALVGSEITFTFVPQDETYYLDYAKLNGEEVLTTYDAIEHEYSYTTEMVEGGFVVQAAFSVQDVASSKGYFEDGKFYKNGAKDNAGNIVIKGTLSDEVEFAGGSGSENDPLIVSTPTQFRYINDLYTIGEQTFTDLHFSQNANLELELNQRISYFAGYYNGNNYSISIKDGVTWEGVASIFGLFYGGKVAAISNVTLNVRENQVLTLFSDANWDENTYVKETYIDGYTVNSLDGKPVRANLNNYGFITCNPIGYLGLGDDGNYIITNQVYEFTNIDINASIINLGTSTGFLVGSGIMYDVYDSLVFKNITVDGFLTGTANAGLLWGNAAYTNPSNIGSYKEMISADDLTVENVTFNGAIYGLNGNATNVCLTPGNPDLLTEEQITAILGTSTLHRSDENVLKGKTIDYRYDTTTNQFVFDKSAVEGLDETYRVVPYINVTRIDFGSNFSNGVKSEIAYNDAVADVASYASITSVKALDIHKAVEQEVITEEDIADLSFENYFNSHVAALLYKDGTLYVIFNIGDGLTTTSVDSTAKIGFYCFNAENQLIGMI